jgi:hypothetical protein
MCTTDRILLNCLNVAFTSFVENPGAAKDVYTMWQG